jgi:hypothetical protein
MRMTLGESIGKMLFLVHLFSYHSRNHFRFITTARRGLHAFYSPIILVRIRLCCQGRDVIQIARTENVHFVLRPSIGEVPKQKPGLEIEALQKSLP